ncbi:MAG: DNA repair protein RecN [Alphaproteobacteria bacterium]|nr:DNA repair protein RecN [Alphaproteobacteria bacterium]
MLTRLSIQDVVLIDKLVIDFADGLNVFTGETGAGKSILLDSLGLAIGERSDASLIRAGATQATVSAEFTSPLPPSLKKLIDEQGLEAQDNLILRRIISKDGKSRAFMNDLPISIGLLKQIGENLLEIHGQSESHGLLNPSTHRGLLDAFAGTASLKAKTAEAYSKWKQAEIDYKNACNEHERAKSEEDFLRAAVSELNDLAPEDGECDRLAQQRTQLQHHEKIVEALQTAEQSLNEDQGASSALAKAGKALSRISDKATELAALLANIDRLAHEIDEASAQITRFLYDIESKPDTLQKIEDRFFALRAVARKHGVAPDALVETQKNLTDRLSLILDREDRFTALAKATVAAKHEYSQLADKLSATRKKAATGLMKQVMQELPSLKLEHARFIVEIDSLPEDKWSADGMDRISFIAATNPNTAPGPLHKVASGGELARFMLAIKVVLAAGNPVPVLVFDEVDAGIGGSTASAVGERLARLADDMQVFAVTHSPQVAARGTNHLRITKQQRGKFVITQATVLDMPSRVEEIARMLAGAQITEAARKAAVSLLEDIKGHALSKKSARA